MSLQVQHIAEWVCTFDGVEGVDSVTGVIDVLPTVWHSITGLVVEEGRGTSWVTRKQNLGRLLLSIASWYDTELDKTFDLNFIRLDALSRDGDVSELLKVMEFMVGSAVQCANKQLCIAAIMAMSDGAQQTLMNLAQALIERPSTRKSEETVGKEEEMSNSAPSGVMAERDELRLRVALLEDEKDQLQKELELAKAGVVEAENRVNIEVAAVRAKMVESFEDMKASLTARNAALQSELDMVQDEEARLRAALEGDQAYRSKRAGGTSVDGGRDQSEDMQSRIRQLEEEKDILTSKLDDYGKLKSQKERYVKKIEDMAESDKEMRKHLAAVEENSAKRLDRILELESNSKERAADKRRLEDLKKKVKELECGSIRAGAEAKARDETLAAVTKQLEEERMQRKFFQDKAEAQEKESQQANDSLDSGAEFDGSHGSSSSSGGANSHVALGGIGDELRAYDNNGSFISPEVKEKIRRLEKEVESLRATRLNPAGAVAADDEESNTGGAMELLAKELESERAVRLGLGREADALRQALAAGATAANGAAEERAADLNRQVKQLSGELKTRREEATRLAAEKEKLEDYTKRALHSVQDKYLLAIKTCKEQLKDKDERIERMTEQYKTFRLQSQREATLLSSAIYELGMNITEQRLGKYFVKLSKFS